MWEISRVRKLNRRPVIWEQSVIPKLLAPDLASYLKRRDERSLYDLLADVYDLKESREEQVLVARPAAPREEELLRLMNFEWVVEITGVSFSTRHTPIDRFRMVFAAKGFAFRLATADAHPVEAVELRGAR